MGYTHYWTQTRDLTEQEMGDIAASIYRIINTAQTREVPCYGAIDDSEDTVLPEICGGDGTGAPVLNKKEIVFNGRGDFGHETFCLAAKRQPPYPGAGPEQRGWASCETARKPYDVVVTACLTFLQADYGFEVSSDGGVDDWEPGVRLAEDALGRAFANPMIVEALVS